MPFRVFCFLFLALAAILFSRVKQFYQNGRGSPKEHFCEIILKSFLWSRRSCHIMFFSISGIGGHFVQQNHLSNDGRGSPKEHFCEIIMISGHWPTWRCCLKVFYYFLALVAILFSDAKVFINFGRVPITEPSGTI